MKKRFFILPLLLLSAMMVRAEKGVTILPLAGSEQQYAISLIGQISFNNKIMYLYDKSGNELGHTPTSEINMIVFQEVTNPVTALDNTPQAGVLVFPNPTQDQLIIRGLQGNQTIRVYDLNGRLVSAMSTDGDNTVVTVSDLQRGTYLLQIGAEVVKFIKV